MYSYFKLNVTALNQPSVLQLSQLGMQCLISHILGHNFESSRCKSGVKAPSLFAALSPQNSACETAELPVSLRLHDAVLREVPAS